MTAQIIPFKFKETEVRTIEKNSLIWFVAGDVAVILGYRDSANMTRVLDEDEADTHIMSIRSETGVAQDREVTIINESGLYHALLKSRKPEAKPFRKWVTAEVLPAIRRNGQYQAPNLKTKTTLPNGLTADQCDAIKALVKARAESCPKEKQGAAAIKCWSSIKSKFGCSYKEIAPEHFVEVLSLVARIELEGEYIPRDELPPIDTAAALSMPGSSLPELSLSEDIRKAISTKAFSLAQEAFELSVDHLAQRVAYEHGTSIKRGSASKEAVLATINAGTLGYALTYGMHEELARIATQAANMRYMATQLEEKIRGGKPQLSAP